MRILRKGNSVLALSLTLGSMALVATAPTTLSAAPAQADTTSCVKAPTYVPTGATPIGSNVSPGSGPGAFTTAVAAKEAKFGTLKAVRVYDPSAPVANAWTARSSITDRTIIESFKMLPKDVLAGTYDAQMLNWFSTAPTTQPIFWSYWHEPESEIADGTFTSADYKAAFQHLVDLAATVCHPNLYPTLILEGYTATSMSKRNYLDYYPGSDYISVMAFDPYNSISKAPTSYVAPSTLFAPQLALAKLVGKPFGIAETGSMLVAGDTTGAARAAWLKSTASWFNANGAAFVTYWDSVGKKGQDYQLNDSNSTGAWKSSILTY